ncbi:tripartite tricarboxylate transporter substrate binding protein [Bordetella sp. 15P40C-2]|uniref:Bug family tripartite tricarboxylate transporter substrate binding protein n=1 Tax=Bordetella sp. 15P40C-2 TaxID=2572246 RepID=UPI001320ACA0|nr:tripartite tricarboxylate transporter substrate binding protein [Bordetella sp. 15P40C-2]MVW70680.1 tripartite tricarboxylate transporter substrate binding protein [Bordetella sp. 15P40C-2]
MRLSKFFRRIACLPLCLGLLSSPVVMAETYPSQPVNLVVGFPAGGPTDLIARLIAQHLGDDLGQKFIVENKGGAGGNIGTKAAARAKPDGYTGLVASLNLTINPWMTEGLDVDSRKDLMPVRTVAVAPTVLVVRNDFPANNFAEFVEAVRKAPNKYNAAAQGASPLLAVELFTQLTNTQITPVPYKGAAAAMVDLIAGHVDMSFATLGSVLPHIKSGKVRVLAVASPERYVSLPDTPTFAEAGMPDFRFDSWTGLLMPAGTSPAVIDTLKQSLDKLVVSPDFEKQVREMGMGPVLQDSPAEFAKTIDRELVLYEKLAASARKKVEK